MAMTTTGRQARVVRCSIMSPGLERRASNDVDRTVLANYGFDVMPYLQKIDIYESVFDNTISGSVSLMENIGLSEYLPLVGVEVLVLVFEIDTEDGVKQFARTFRIVALKHQSFPHHEFRMYTLQLVTHEFVLSMSSRISRAYKAVSCHEAVTNILAENLLVEPDKLIVSEDTYETVTVTIPNYTPLMAINYFAMLAETKDRRNSNFLFFETLDGFHFTSLASLATQPAVAKFHVDSGIAMIKTLTEQREINSISRVHQDQAFDLLFDIASGKLRSRMVHFDFLARKLLHVDDVGYSEAFDKTKNDHLDSFPCYPDNFDKTVAPNVRIFTVPSNLWSSNSAYLTSFGDQPQQRMHESILRRNRQLKEMTHVQTLLDMPGHPHLRAGSVVEVFYPDSRPLQGADGSITQPLQKQPTPYYSGRHLVTSIHHILLARSTGSMQYTMNLAVNRDSFGSPLIGAAN